MKTNITLENQSAHIYYLRKVSLHSQNDIQHYCQNYETVEKWEAQRWDRETVFTLLRAFDWNGYTMIANHEKYDCRHQSEARWTNVTRCHFMNPHLRLLTAADKPEKDMQPPTLYWYYDSTKMTHTKTMDKSQRRLSAKARRSLPFFVQSYTELSTILYTWGREGRSTHIFFVLKFRKLKFL